MPILKNWQLELTIDQILRAQGADPQAARERSPRLVETAHQALELGLPLLEPVVAYRKFKLKAIQHERLLLSDNGTQAALTGKGVVRLLAPARQVVALLCTIGAGLENLASAMLPANPPLGLALDAAGSAAVESLLEAACGYFGEEAAGREWESTIPFSPGMEDWPTGPGQEQVFSLLDGGGALSVQAGVSLAPSGMMAPQKSLTAVLGLGPEVEGSGRVCDYCSVQQTCRYKDSYL